jgi:hypothetical protein
MSEKPTRRRVSVSKKEDTNNKPDITSHIVQAFLQSGEFAGLALQFGSSINKLIESVADRQIQRSEIQKKELENNIVIHEIKLKEQEIELRRIESEQKYIRGFDIRDRLISFATILLLFIVLIVLASMNFFDKQTIALFLGIISTGVAFANKDTLMNILNSKSNKKSETTNDD